MACLFSVCFCELDYTLSKFWSVSVLAAGLIDEYFVNIELAQQDFLPRGVLFLGADADVANFHFFSPFSITIIMVN